MAGEAEQRLAADQMATLVPSGLDFSTMPGLSREVRERLIAQRPDTLADVRFVPGMTPAALTLIGRMVMKHERSVGAGQ